MSDKKNNETKTAVKRKVLQSIGARITLAFGVMVLLIGATGAVGWYNSHKMGDMLNFMANDVYQAGSDILRADGSNNAEDKFIERIIADMKDDLHREQLPQHTEITDTAYGEVRNAGVISEETLVALDTAREVNGEDVDQLLAKDSEYAERYANFTENLRVLLSILEEVEVTGDEMVEQLASAPNDPITWNGGLKSAWTAADGAMEASIAIYQQVYYFEAILSGQDEAYCNEKITEAQEMMTGALESITASGAAQRQIPDGPHAGQPIAATLNELAGKQQAMLAELARINDEKVALVDRYRTSAEVLANAYNAAVSEADNLAAETLANIPVMMRTVLFSIVLAIAIGLVVACVSAVISVRLVVRPIGFVVERLRDIAEGEGDLTRRLNMQRGDEIGTLAFWFDTFVAKIHETVRNVADCTHTLSASSEQAAATSRGMSDNADGMSKQSTSAAAATEQASSSIRNVAAAIEEISVNSNTVADEAGKVSSNLNNVGVTVEEVSSNMTTIAAAVEEMSSSLNTIASSVEEMSTSLRGVSDNTTEAAALAGNAETKANTTAATVNRLGASAKEIDKVVDLITGIAEQTNLLALNATIEAASAGEAGKGFAVVANEVKELAKQTSNATQEIRQQVEGMQSNTGEAVTAIGEIVDVIKRVNEAFGLIASAVNEQSNTINEIVRNVSDAARGGEEVSRNVQEAAKSSSHVSGNVQEAIVSVDAIARSVNELAGGANEIARNASEAAQGMNEVAQNVQSVNQSAQTTRGGAEELTAASSDLAGLAGQLRQLVGSFAI
ncbi:MAG: HAMP domain-containing protein [Candidatus Hydrogenedens sp.]|nr:HAMP domain-containing protein [Candidatus Hydrogenedens sp.]